MRHEEKRNANAALQVFELGADLFAKMRVERRQRLVEQQNVGHEHQGPRQGYALTLSSRKIARHPQLLAGQAHLLEHPFDMCFDPIRAFAAEAELDVTANGKVREQSVALKHGVDIAAVRRKMIDAGSVQPHFARGRRFESGDQTQHRGLAASGGAKQRKKRATLDLERNAVHGAVRREML